MFLTFLKRYQKCFLKKRLAKIKNFRNKKYKKLINGGGGGGGGLGPNKVRGGRKKIEKLISGAGGLLLDT